MFSGSIGHVLAVGFVTIGMITAASMPDRHTAQVATAGGNALARIFGTVIGTTKPK